ncbi:hypothetical protein P171DRAFT_484417 [Karstenula rhodostoma CBS 690.94]|uniref:Uncharacterized protein n=1 Tax=Karstenula rhodostoma CBS 690.94 TaxID=1392251 RepID=A0A9P4PM01_9PLEO|nr:hypothetical protein P171DRAFT_484417 [Karstenula rhodostoma CBS 690.94]
MKTKDKMGRVRRVRRNTSLSIARIDFRRPGPADGKSTAATLAPVNRFASPPLRTPWCTRDPELRRVEWSRLDWECGQARNAGRREECKHDGPRHQQHQQHQQQQQQHQQHQQHHQQHHHDRDHDHDRYHDRYHGL